MPIVEVEATPDATTSRRVGQVLAAARGAAKLELADIARDTRVPIRHLRAIEDDNHDALPALPYAIGFVKSFARAVHLDPEAVATQFRGETNKTAHVPAVAAIEPLDQRRMPPRGLMTLSIVGVIVVVGLVIAYSAGMFARPAGEVTAPALAPATGATAPDAAATVADAPPPSPGTVAAPTGGVVAAPVGGAALPVPTGPVSITATEDVWIKVYVRGSKTTVKMGNLAAGERYDVPADPPGLLLWTGRAGALKISIGGRELPPLGGPAQTVKDVSLVPADLVARTSASAAAAAAVPVAIPAVR